jgi:hypothetical protein
MGGKHQGLPPGQIENRFNSEQNELKFCAEVPLHNFLIMIHCSDTVLDLFWKLTTSPFHTVTAELGQKCVPKNVITEVLARFTLRECTL